jgi:hypothetical protein
VPNKPRSRYDVIIERIFARHHSARKLFFEFTREEFEETAMELGIKLPKNIGDVLYSFRYRKELPESICKTAAVGREWIFELTVEEGDIKVIEERHYQLVAASDISVNDLKAYSARQS